MRTYLRVLSPQAYAPECWPCAAASMWALARPAAASRSTLTTAPTAEGARLLVRRIGCRGVTVPSGQAGGGVRRRRRRCSPPVAGMRPVRSDAGRPTARAGGGTDIGRRDTRRSRHGGGAGRGDGAPLRRLRLAVAPAG